MNELAQTVINLSTQEADRFDDLEICIANGLQTFVEVGEALAEIRESRLYRERYDTFENYCQKRWGLTRRHVNHMIAASITVDNLGTMVPAPQSERQARPLTKFNDNPELQREVWETVVNTAPDGKVTAKHVTDTISKMTQSQGENGRYQPIEYDETDQSSGYFEDDYGEPYTVAKQPTSQTPGIMSSGGSNGVDMTTGNGRDISALMSSASDEWYTTPDILEAVREVMCGIDLDPASSEKANETVSASVFFSKEDDGLSKEWWGRVYVNPPYGNEIPKWVDKINAEYEAGNLNQLILLVPSRTDTRWFRALKKYPRCFMHGRVKFNGHENSAPFPTMLVGVGVDIKKFTEVMENLGDVYTWHTNSESN